MLSKPCSRDLKKQPVEHEKKHTSKEYQKQNNQEQSYYLYCGFKG